MLVHTPPQLPPGGIASLYSLQTQVPLGYLSFIASTLENLNQDRMRWQWLDLAAENLKRDRFQELLDTMVGNGEIRLVKQGKKERYVSQS